MNCEINSFNDFNIPRVAQLSQRSNQFNLRTIRYTEEDVKRIIDSDQHFDSVLILKIDLVTMDLLCSGFKSN